MGRGRGTVTATGPSEPNFGTDTCWLVLSSGDRYAYVTNFFSSSISSYRVGPRGRLTLLDPIANATIGDGAADMAPSGNRRYLYVRNALLGTPLAFQIKADGNLTQIR